VVVICNIVGMCFGIPLSHAGDLYSRRWLIVIPSSISIAGFIIISRAQSIGTLLAGLTLAGFAFATQPQLYATACEQLPLRRYRAAVQSLLAVTTGVASVLALVITGALLRHGDAERYRIFWYIMVAVQVPATFTFALLNHRPTNYQSVESSLSMAQSIARLPWLSYSIMFAGLSLLIIGVAWGQTSNDWHDPVTLGPTVAGGLLMFSLLTYESFNSGKGLLDMSLVWTNRN
jgi:hypothetical protein